ncbi:TonB-dependent receptor domain-containing protein [Parasphingorhabdus sp.]|uniref:TonB-dependent receptor domain-containing protein n=1 Tax=Parasphingorhabdus sp. TaxID=2709688 RepID=UPI003A901C1D
MITYEVGAKTSWFDRSLVFNAAVFFEDFSDKQASSVAILANGLPGVKPVNAAAAEVWGLEIDATWQPIESLMFTGSYAYLHARYKDFKSLTSNPGSIATAGECVIKMVESASFCEIDNSGNSLENVPTHSLNISGRYTHTISDALSVYIEMDGRYQGKRFDNSSNSRWYDGYWLSDLQVGLRGENWELIGYVKNVFDDDTIRVGTTTTDLRTFTLPSTIFNVGKPGLPDPRTFGVRANFRF